MAHTAKHWSSWAADHRDVALGAYLTGQTYLGTAMRKFLLSRFSSRSPSRCPPDDQRHGNFVGPPVRLAVALRWRPVRQAGGPADVASTARAPPVRNRHRCASGGERAGDAGLPSPCPLGAPLARARGQGRGRGRAAS